MVVVGVAVGLQSGWLERQYDRAFNDPVLQTGDYRDRLFNPGFNRQDRWKVAVEAFEDAPLAGQGAGTYRLFWERERPTDSDTNDAHSLYLETLGELGVVGFVLLAGALVLMFGAMAARLRGRDRSLWAALLSTGLVWALHAAVDWDWELPVVTLWLFAAGGLALAAAGDRAVPRRLGLGIRVAVAVALGAAGHHANPHGGLRVTPVHEPGRVPGRAVRRGRDRGPLVDLGAGEPARALPAGGLLPGARGQPEAGDREHPGGDRARPAQLALSLRAGAGQRPGRRRTPARRLGRPSA